MKLTIEDVAHVLNELQIEPDKKKEILNRLSDVEDAAKTEKTERKKKEKREVIICLKYHEALPPDIVGAVFELPQDSDPLTFTSLLRTAAVNHNLAQKKKMNMVNDFSTALSFIKPKFLKEQGIKRLSGKDYWATQQITEKLLHD